MATSVASALWSTASAGARWLSRRGWLASHGLGARTVSVGNLQAGGAGKTPLVARVAREALERGLSVCILTRGYGGGWERAGGVLAPGGERPHPQLCGDEAALLQELVPGAWIGVGRDRVARYRAACARKGGSFDLVILDDGFQHWRIRKDLEIVALTSHTPDSRIHRDFASQLRHAQLAVWTKGEREPDSRGIPLVRVRSRLKVLASTPGEGPLWLVTGVADGAAVRSDIEAAGFAVSRHSVFPDHARYSDLTRHEISRLAREAGCRLAMTGKDWVKWRALGEPQEPMLVFEPELELVSGQPIWEKVLWGR